MSPPHSRQTCCGCGSRGESSTKTGGIEAGVPHWERATAPLDVGKKMLCDNVVDNKAGETRPRADPRGGKNSAVGGDKGGGSKR